MKKFFLLLLATICAVCMGVAVACSGEEGEYYSLVFRPANGVTYNSEIPSGVEVLAGTEVRFSITLSDQAEGDPVVYKVVFRDNAEVSEELERASDGTYSFVIEENTVVKVLGVTAPGPEYNNLIFDNTPGVEVKFKNVSNGQQLQNGMLVRNGTQVDFEVTVKDGFYVDNASGEPVVKVNGERLTTTGQTETGYGYSFVMNGPANITVEQVTKNIKLMYVNGDSRVSYFTPEGDPIEADREIFDYKLGEVIKFKVKISVYYVQSGYDVQSNTSVLTPDGDGIYTVQLEDDTNISVTNLVQEECFTDRDDGGLGTQRNPFHISRPIDLWQMSALVNSSFLVSDQYRAGYYVLDNDIDMENERLYVIGSQENEYAFFAGTFDGQGHTIKNFYIEDRIVEQENFQTMILQSVGLFGALQPLNGHNPAISNLTLENYTVHADASQYSYQLSVGSFAGMGYGVTITNCYAKGGYLDVTGGIAAAYVGGIIGQQVSAYSETSNIAVESRVIGCHSDSTIEVPSSVQALVYATGGITGLLGVGERNVSAYVMNSYFTGSIDGGLHAGGIVGYASDHTSVVNCYSNGSVTARSPFSSANYMDYVFHAYAGGIVSELGYDAIVYGCFSSSELRAEVVRQGSEHKTEDIVVVYDGKDDQYKRYGQETALVVNSVGNPERIDEAFLTGTLHWNMDEWKMVSGYPVVNEEGLNNQPNITISFTVDSNFGSVSQRTSAGYKSLAQWGKINGAANIPEYMVGQGSYRSYGYFFDADHTQKVPLGFVFTHDITLYIGSADYNEISGTYYLDGPSENEIFITFSPDGTSFFRDGAITQTADYFYDGKQIVILNSALGSLSEVDLGSDSEIIQEYFMYYYNFCAKIDNGAITITGGNVDALKRDTTDNIVSADSIIVLFPEANPLRGLKDRGLKYGEYYADNGQTVYGFNGNGTGYKITKGPDEESETSAFTFVYSQDGQITLNYAGGVHETVTYADDVIKTVNEKEVKPYDGFAGVWEAAYGIDRKYTFDGVNKWSSGTSQGTYTIEDNTLNGGDFTAKINRDGFLEITSGGNTITYYREGSLKGEWYFSGRTATNNSISVNLVLEGLTDRGYGKATATYASGQVFELNYEIRSENVIDLYYNDGLYATLTYSTQNRVLSGDFAGLSARFTAFDTIIGMWLTDDEDIRSLNFNGNGFYNLSGDSQHGYIAVRGSVQINGSTRVSYTIDPVTAKGQLSYSGVEYEIAYDADTDSVKLTASDKVINLQHRDEWYGKELKDAAGKRYVFDGGGRLSRGGKITVYGVSGDIEDTPAYKIEGETIKVTSDYEGNSTITIESRDGHQVFVMKKDDTSQETILYRNTPFNGTWLIGTVRGELVISEIYADDTATGSYKYESSSHKTDVQFTYHSDGNYLEFTYSGDTTYYINALETGSERYLSFGPDNTFSSNRNYTCIPNDAKHKDSMFDKFYYVYDPDTGENTGRLVFDGLGNTTGIVTYYGLSGSDIDYANVISRYTYSMGNFGYGEKTYQYAKIFNQAYEYLLISCEQEDDLSAYREVLYYLCDESGANYFAVVYPDELYNNVIRDGLEDNKYYIFDGVGGVTEYVEGGTATFYTYTIDVINTETFIHELTFTDDRGNTYKVILNQSNTEDESQWTVTFEV